MARELITRARANFHFRMYEATRVLIYNPVALSAIRICALAFCQK